MAPISSLIERYVLLNLREKSKRSKHSKLMAKPNEASERNRYISETFLEGSGYDTANGKPVHYSRSKQRRRRKKGKVQEREKENLEKEFGKLQLGTQSFNGHAEDGAEQQVPRQSLDSENDTAMVYVDLDLDVKEVEDINYADNPAYAVETEWGESAEEKETEAIADEG